MEFLKYLYINNWPHPAPRRHTALIERECDDRDDEIALLKSKVGEITMDNELLYAKVEVLEGIHPPITPIALYSSRGKGCRCHHR